jgi:2-polyprenyl-3-methyl-5-hydroxy-6-metoxy-1,4-benzoquinol methylase
LAGATGSSAQARSSDTVVADTERYETVACNICGGTSFRVVHEARPHETGAVDLARTFRSSGDERLVDRVVACTSCGLQFVNPRLKPEAILEGYREGADEQFVSQVRGRELTFAKCLDIIERQRPGLRGRVLDIGTAGGSFLKVAADRGWQVDGCEPNVWLCEWANAHYGLGIRPGTVFEQEYPAAAFDVVTLWDVLEHTPDPRRVIEECQRLLKPGGLLVINYPDIGSWVARAMRAKAYVGGVAGLAERGLRGVGLKDAQIPYWMGQTLVIAARTATPARADQRVNTA